MSDLAIVRVVEFGELTEETDLGAILSDCPMNGTPCCAAGQHQPDDIIPHWFKVETISGSRLVFFGTAAELETFRLKYSQ